MRYIEHGFKIGDLQFRDELDEVIVTKNRLMLHIPDSEDPDVPSCNNTRRAKKYVNKPIETYPDGYRKWCGACLRCNGVDV